MLTESLPSLPSMTSGAAVTEDPEVVFAHAYVDPPPGFRDG